MNCEHECVVSASFPMTISNRAALSRIAYRIGHYVEMRDHMLFLLNAEPALYEWTHREFDDPGIALLESAALLGDVLTFYQDLYANEVWLRTASWRESVAELVRLVGYRLAPGLGGEGTFAVTVKGDEPIVVPAGFGFKARLEDQAQDADFESTSELEAWPHLGAFHIYRPRLGQQPILVDATRLELHAVEGATDPASLAAVTIASGDRIMLVPSSRMFDRQNTSYSDQEPTEILIVADVERILDRMIIHFEGSLTVDRNASIRAFVIGRTFSHFGADAPVTLSTVDQSDATSVSHTSTRFKRRLHGTSPNPDYYSELDASEMPFDREVDDLAARARLICQGQLTFRGQSDPVPFAVPRKIVSLRADALVWGNLNGSGTVATLEDSLIRNRRIRRETVDIRRLRFHEVLGPRLTLRAGTAWDDGAFTDGVVNFYGTPEQARTLAQRALLLVHDNGETQSVTVSSTADDFDQTDSDETQSYIWPLTLSALPAFTREDFDEAAPQVTVHGNLIAATQGKTEAEVVLGHGDERQTFQTFAIPKAPLTYLLDPTRTPAETPELEIYVDGVLWERASTFFDVAATARVYVVREDEDRNSHVQFGNGINGARLPSGRNNVVALYRTGTGAVGDVEAGQTPSAADRLDGLDTVLLPGPVVGGAQTEDADNAREAAPGTMQSLGRIVGLADYEAETLRLAGVLKAHAEWTAPEGTPLVQLTVLTDSGDDAALENITATLQTYNRCRGPARHPIIVVAGVRRYVRVALQAGYDADRRVKDIEAAIKTTLGLGGEEGDGIDNEDGLFGLATRAFGRDVHPSQIIGITQQVDGVAWVQLTAAQILRPAGPDAPTDLTVPEAATVAHTLACQGHEILNLHTAHFELTLTMDEANGACVS